MSVLLLPGAIAASYVSDMTLPIVAETRPVDAFVIFAISVSVASADFVQMEDCIATLV